MDSIMRRRDEELMRMRNMSGGGGGGMGNHGDMAGMDPNSSSMDMSGMMMMKVSTSGCYGNYKDDGDDNVHRFALSKRLLMSNCLKGAFVTFFPFPFVCFILPCIISNECIMLFDTPIREQFNHNK